MAQENIEILNSVTTAAFSAADRILDLSQILYDSKARSAEEIQYVQSSVSLLPDIRPGIPSDLEFSPAVDEKYSISKALEEIGLLSDRIIAFKVLARDLVPLLTDDHMPFSEISAYFPYLDILLNQIEAGSQSIHAWYDQQFQPLYDRLENDLMENEDYMKICEFVDQSLSFYSKSHDNEDVRSFRDYALDALNRYAEGDDDVRFRFTLKTRGDSGIGWITISLDGCIEASATEYVVVPFGGDTEKLWSFFLWRSGESDGTNGIEDYSNVMIGREWELSILSPEEYEYFEE